MIDMVCPYCQLEFEAEQYETGNCPNCGKEYWFDELCYDDYSECYDIVEWE